MTKKKIKLGDKVRCGITGFEGTAIARTEHIHGCVQIDIIPLVDEDGKLQDTVSIDEPQLVVIEEKESPEPEPSGGGHRPKPRGRK